MNLRKTIAGAALSAALIVGAGSTAFAADPPPERPPASPECKAALVTLRDLRVIDARLRAEYARVLRLRTAADKAGKTELVKKLDVQLTKMRAAHAKVVAKVKAAADLVREECAPAEPAAA